MRVLLFYFQWLSRELGPSLLASIRPTVRLASDNATRSTIVAKRRAGLSIERWLQSDAESKPSFDFEEKARKRSFLRYSRLQTGEISRCAQRDLHIPNSCHYRCLPIRPHFHASYVVSFLRASAISGNIPASALVISSAVPSGIVELIARSALALVRPNTSN